MFSFTSYFITTAYLILPAKLQSEALHVNVVSLFCHG